MSIRRFLIVLHALAATACQPASPAAPRATGGAKAAKAKTAAPATMQVVEVARNLFMVGDRTFSLFYITDTSVIVVDPISDRHVKAMRAEIRQRTNLPISHVFYSHNHWDHIGGAAGLMQSDTQVVAHTIAAQAIPPRAGIVMPTHTWSGARKTYEIGGKKLELYYFGPNHGAGMTVFRFPEHDTVFIVDLVVADRVLYAYLPDAKPRAWRRTLDSIQALSYSKALFAHNRPVGTRADVTELQNYFDALYVTVDQALARGTPTFDIPGSISLPDYAHWKMYNQWLPLNVWRILMEKQVGQ